MWQTEFFFILDHFLPFYPPNNPENQNFENMKKHLEISSLYVSVPKIMIISHTIPEIQCKTCNFYFSFWAIFCLFTPLITQKINIFKIWKKKKHLEISSFVYRCVYTKNNDHMMYCYWDMVHDRRTDRKSDIARGVPHLKMWRQSQHKEEIWEKSYEYLENSKANHIKSFAHGQYVNIMMQDPVIDYFQIRVYLIN